MFRLNLPFSSGCIRPDAARQYFNLIAILAGLFFVNPLVDQCFAQSEQAIPKVDRMKGELKMGDVVTLHMKGLKEWSAAGNHLDDLRLFIDGRELRGIQPFGWDLEQGNVSFLVKFTDQDETFWDDLLRRPSLKLSVSLSAGASGGVAFPTELTGSKKPFFKVIRSGLAWLAFFLIGGIGFMLVNLARTTAMLRDKGEPGSDPQTRTYSLARTQAAFWFFLIVSAYITIWVLTGALDTITQSLLGLMGISAGTMLGGAMVDQNKKTVTKANGTATISQDSATQQEATSVSVSKSQGFLTDVLSDSSGYNFHRFQMFVWTIVLGIIFVSSVYTELQMPDFSNTLLGLMGISAGTYVSLKLQEK